MYFLLGIGKNGARAHHLDGASRKICATVTNHKRGRTVTARTIDAPESMVDTEAID